MSQSKTVNVLFRTLRFKDGGIHRVPLRAFRDRDDSFRAGKQATDAISNLHPAVAQAFNFIGIDGISHDFMEMEMTEGAGLVIVGPGDIPGS